MHQAGRVARLVKRWPDGEGWFGTAVVMRWSLFLSGMQSRTRAVAAGIAALPIVVVISRLAHVPGFLAWTVSGAGGIFVVVRARGGDLPLSPSDRRLAALAVLTGAATGDPNIDAYALDVLETRLRIGALPERIALSVVMVLLVAAPVAVSITSSAWWLLMEPLDAALAAGAFYVHSQPDVLNDVKHFERGPGFRIPNSHDWRRQRPRKPRFRQL